MTDSSSRMGQKRKGIMLGLCAVLFVSIWRLWIIIQVPAHWMAFATAFGSVSHKGYLHPNLDGTALLYDQETESGIGGFFWGAATGESKQLFERKEEDEDVWRSKILDWSTDGSLFACVVPSHRDPGALTEEIVLYNGNNGDVNTRIPIDEYDKHALFTWLSPQSFAYSSRNQSLSIIEEQSPGVWTQTHFYQHIIKGNAGKGANGKKLPSTNWEDLRALSPQSVVWRVGQAIWMFDCEPASSKKIWDSPTNALQSFTCTKDGNLNLRCFDEKGQYSIIFSPPGKGANSKGSVLSVTRDDEEQKRVVFTELNGVCSFSIRTNASTERLQFIWQGEVERWKLAGMHLFFVGSSPNEPTGIWQYDISAHELSSVIPGIKDRSSYGKMVNAVYDTATNTEGQTIRYCVWQPAGVVAGKTYPLIIGEGHKTWFPYQQVAANEGYYFATVARPSWDEGLDDWAEDVGCLYKIVTQSPNIDTNRVFLFATSAETGYLREVVAEKPHSWRGVILFSPSDLPDLATAQLSKMLIVDGRKDGHATERLSKYQDEAASVGIPVKLVLLNDAGHTARSMATEREQTRQFARFLVEN